ncbi:MAG: type II toxin-antitoxin system VapB family antitoxin [Roseofilum sp. SID3]|uniref:type II toxin-antitoxin system VapB family antitoxin n=1 Tax=Roseofilum sp. SID3 TaxID=2821499 RepID=UPI001B2C0065|nr:type II toxin-antitoxin system VapB family antitoxin [Roseofilum sp. SID3]MBP0015771.1 type II toxin-antitoxin system VapB family antitoxin [Roseofilum sp. SID3]
MKAPIELNEDLVNEAFSLTDCQTEQELIDLALQELIRTRKKRNLLDLSGQIQFSDNTDYKELRSNRNVSD